MVNQGAIWRTETLSPQTWPLFADLVERHNGVYRGCWCLGFHPETAMPGIDRRATKQQMVDEGRTHAELVLDEDGTCRGWAQWGSVEELSAIKHLRAYLKDEPERPQWRITCVFVDKSCRGQGVARVAVEAALARIGELGGGLVEVISEVTDGRTAQGRFLFTVTAEVFDSMGFDRVRQVGKHAWIMNRQV